MGIAITVTACASEEPAFLQDGPDDSFLGDKADTGIAEEGSPEAIAVLKIVNTETRRNLADFVDLGDQVAELIVSYRIGDDGVVGTADDNPFDTLAELDLVPHVGPLAFERLVTFAREFGRIVDVVEAKTELAYSIRYGSAVLGGDGEVYLFGPGSLLGSDAFGFDFQTYVLSEDDAVVNLGLTRNVRAHSAAAATRAPGRDGSIWVIGGEVGNVPSTRVVAHRAGARNSDWSDAPSLNVARDGAGLAAGSDDRLYAIGGVGADGDLDSLEILTPAANAWTLGPAMPTPRKNLGVVTGTDGRIYAIGGLTGTVPSRVAEVFDPVTAAWSALPELPRAMLDPSITVDHGGRILVIGGLDPETARPSRSVQIYDPTTGAWSTSKFFLQQARHGAMSITALDGRVYTFSGITSDGSTSYGVEAVDPSHF